MQEEIDYDAINYAKEELQIEDEELLKGRMSEHLIKTINEVKLKHRSSITSS